MTKKLVVLGCVLVGAVALYIAFFRTSDEERIRKVLDEFGKAVMIKEGDTILSRTARIRDRMPKLVEDDVRVDVAEMNVAMKSRKELEENGAKAGMIYTQADVDFTKTTIKIDPAGTIAQVDSLAIVTGMRAGERKADHREVHFLLRKNGDWKISTMDVAAARKED